MAINKLPDVFMTWEGGFLEKYIRLGKVMPLDEFLEKDPVWLGSFLNNTLDSLRYEGKVYAIPQVRAMAVLYYNKKIFHQLGLKKPATYSDLKQIVKPLRKAGIIPIAFGNREPWIGGMLAGQIIQRLGGEKLFVDVKNGTIPWTHPSFIKAGEILRELSILGAFPERPNMISYPAVLEMFYGGKAAIMLMGSWFIQYVISRNSLDDDRIGVMKFPAFDSGKGSVNAWMGQNDMNLAISEQCNEKESAIAFIKWITSPPYQRDLMLKAGLLPATKVQIIAAEDVRPELLSLIELQRDMESIFPFPDVGLGGSGGPAFNECIKSIFNGEKPQEAFLQLQEELGSAKINP